MVSYLDASLQVVLRAKGGMICMALTNYSIRMTRHGNRNYPITGDTVDFLSVKLERFGSKGIVADNLSLGQFGYQ